MSIDGSSHPLEECVGCRKESGGIEMEHFTTEKWIEFVNQVVGIGEKQLMEKHLKEFASYG